MSKQSFLSRVFRTDSYKNDINRSGQGSMVDVRTGLGTGADRMSSIYPIFDSKDPRDSVRWLASNGIIQRILTDAPNEITRTFDGFEVNEAEGSEEAAWLEKRWHEIDVPGDVSVGSNSDAIGLQLAINTLGVYANTFTDGGLLFLGVEETAPVTEERLKEPLSLNNLRKLDYVTPLTPRDFRVEFDRLKPTSKTFNRIKKVWIGGAEVHPSRVIHMVYSRVDDRSFSLLEKIYESARDLKLARHGIGYILYTIAYWIFKSPAFGGANAKKTSKMLAFLSRLKLMMNTQAMVTIADSESFDRNVQGPRGAKEGTDFLFEMLAAETGIPQNRIKGQAKGAIAGADNDERQYFMDLEKERERRYRPIYNRFVELLKWESTGKLRANNPDSLNIEIEFKPFFVANPKEDAEVEKIEAETSQAYFNTGALSGDDIRLMKFPELGKLDIQEENGDLKIMPPARFQR